VLQAGMTSFESRDFELPIINSERLFLRLGTKEDISYIVNYFKSNEDFHNPFSPLRPEAFFTEEFWNKQLELDVVEFVNDYSLKLFIFKKGNLREVIGNINFRNFTRGAAQYCTLGYSLAQSQQGKGLMTEALESAIKYVFHELNIHRIMANYMPHNRRSGNLLKRLGFVIEGYARDYLMINGQWEDHILTSLTNSHWV
jgi:[ribosomal protein S5]-alanine N-acetyltransferase